MNCVCNGINKFVRKWYKSKSSIKEKETLKAGRG